jgi:hypothetical protein
MNGELSELLINKLKPNETLCEVCGSSNGFMLRVLPTG